MNPSSSPRQRLHRVPLSVALSRAVSLSLSLSFVTDNDVNRISSNNDDRIAFALDLSLLLRDLRSTVAIASEYSTSSSTATTFCNPASASWTLSTFGKPEFCCSGAFDSLAACLFFSKVLLLFHTPLTIEKKFKKRVMKNEIWDFAVWSLWWNRGQDHQWNRQQ